MLYYLPHVLQMKFQRKLDFFEKTLLEDVRYVNRWCIDSGDSSIHGKGDLRQCETAGAGFENSCAAEVFLPGGSARPLGRGQPWWWEVVCPWLELSALCFVSCLVTLWSLLYLVKVSSGLITFTNLVTLVHMHPHVHVYLHLCMLSFMYTQTQAHTHTHTCTHSCPCSHTFYYQVSDECVNYLSLRFLFVHEERMDLLGDTCWHCYSQSRCTSPAQFRLLKAFLHFEFHLQVSQAYIVESIFAFWIPSPSQPNLSLAVWSVGLEQDLQVTASSEPTVLLHHWYSEMPDIAQADGCPHGAQGTDKDALQTRFYPTYQTVNLTWLQNSNEQHPDVRNNACFRNTLLELCSMLRKS